MTGVKVCGLTRAEDVRVAAELGAWALGFVLTLSVRQVSPGRATELGAVARAVCAPQRGGAAEAGGARLGAAGRHEARPDLPHLVAVVADEPAAWIADALAESGADAVQLSAGADGPRVTAVREAAARLRRQPLVIAAADTADAQLADLILLDARVPGAYGGTGTTLDWEALAADPRSPAGDVVLAGGLRAGNVGTAVALLRPAVVDVSSGVESTPGLKDHGLLRDFFAAVERADRGLPARGVSPAADTTTRRTTG